MQFSNCVTVKGFLRSAIYDLQRNRYILVPNSFSDLMQSNNNKIPLSDCNPDFKSYLDGLVEDNWGVYTTKKAADQFPALSLYWDHFATVTNAQIDLHKENDEIRFFFKKTLPQFEELICKDYQINFPEAIEYDEIFSFLTSFNDTRVESITLVVPYLSAPREQLLDLFKKQPRLKTLFFHSSPETKYSGKDKIFYIRDHINIREKNIVLTDYFTSNVSLFSE
ncbi:MAG: hypothetical protein JWO44_1785, partial [Bacteroidetes bacterium]|nr:hypothetical protein [Bacteroidota bacterium]